MKTQPLSSRRQLLTGATGLAAASVLPVAQTQAQISAGISREQYDQYVEWFNENDPRFTELYHDEVELELSNAIIKGKQGILNFYAEVKAHIKETVTIEHFVSDATGLAVVIPTEFKCFKDWDSSFFRRHIKKGEVFRVVSFGMYWVTDGKFKTIKASRYKLINDWQMEG